ncbi:steroid 21-hydroxylase-like isoform X3 [Taeniopygia guttata]|uniref:steroid 21-hydroxylase-like isoform X3 n=1 Tax=Taeniopygia guttata TaxID=59729 RepID=UPI003BB91ADC
MVLLCVLLLSLLLSLLSLLSLLLSLRRRGDGRGPRLGALHLLHPQGALHLSRLARRHGPVLRLRLGGRGLSTWFGISSSFGVAPSPSSSLQTCWCRARWRPSVRRWSGTGGTGWGAPPVTWGRWCHRGAGTWHWEALALAGGGSGEQCGEHWHGLGGVLGPSFGCRVRSCVRSYVPMERLPWTPLRCSPSIPAAPSHASSLGTWWGFGWAQDGDRGLEEDPSFYGAQGFGGGPRSLWRGHPAVWGTEQFVGGWQGFGGTQEFEGTQVSKMMLGVFWGIQRELEYWTVHRCVLLQVPPPGELRAFSRCLGELLQVWGHSSVRVLDLLPLLRALPNPGLRKLLRLVQHRDTFVEAQIQRHQACPSPPPDTVLGALLGHNFGARGGPLSPPRLHMALVDLFIGGTETTAAALGWAVAFLLHRPETWHTCAPPVQLQARLRAELEGAQGPPGPGDMGRLPLLQATVSETLRLRPPAPLALPHCALRHTSLGGLPVVAGTVLVPNLLAAQQDPDIWQHPEVFLPERFLAPGAPSRSLLPFGCGARSCPGEGLARAELFVFLGLILREFRLEPGPGGLPGLKGSPGTVLRCPPFRLRMVPCQPLGSP